MAAHPCPAGSARPEPPREAFPAGGAGSAQPKAEQPGRHAEPPMAACPCPAGSARPEPWRAALPAGGAGSVQQKAERPGRRAGRLPAVRLRRAGEQGPLAREAGERRAGLPALWARQADAAASGGRPAPRWEQARRGAREGPPAARPDVPVADARPAARHAAAAQAWQAAADGAPSEPAASAAGAGPAAGRGQRRVFPGRAGRAVRLPAPADAVARADPRLRKREPVRPCIRPGQRPVRLAKGRGPAGRSRPATSVSCAFLFPSFVSTCGYQAPCGLNPR